MTREQRIKRNQLIYDLDKQNLTYREIQGQLIRKGFGEFHVVYIGEIARKMKKELEGKVW